MRNIWNRFRRHRAAIKAVRSKYGRFLPYPLAAQWAKEDAAFNRMAESMFSAASRGVDVGFMNDCPDLYRFAMDRKRK